MTDEKRVLVIGLDPTLIDFSQPGYAPGMDATRVLACNGSAIDDDKAGGGLVLLARCPGVRSRHGVT